MREISPVQFNKAVEESIGKMVNESSNRLMYRLRKKVAVVPMGARTKEMRKVMLWKAITDFQYLRLMGYNPVIITNDQDYRNFSELFSSIPKEAQLSRESSLETANELNLVKKKLEENRIRDIVLIANFWSEPSFLRMKHDASDVLKGYNVYATYIKPQFSLKNLISLALDHIDTAYSHFLKLAYNDKEKELRYRVDSRAPVRKFRNLWMNRRSSESSVDELKLRKNL